MKTIINALIIFAIFWLGNEYFNEYISIVDTRTMIIAVLLIAVIDVIYLLIGMASIVTIPLGIGCITTIIWLAVLIAITPIELLLLDKYLVGFNITGFWTYAILTVSMSMFTISSNTKKEA